MKSHNSGILTTTFVVYDCFYPLFLPLYLIIYREWEICFLSFLCINDEVGSKKYVKDGVREIKRKEREVIVNVFVINCEKMIRKKKTF